MSKDTEIAVPTNSDERKSLLDTMTPDCREAALAMEKLDHKVRTGTAMVAWEMGAWVDTVARDDTKYGVMAVPQIAAYIRFPQGANGLNKLRDLYDTFKDRDAFVKELNKPRRDGQQLDLGHFLALAKLADKKAQTKLLKLIRDENMSVNDFEVYTKANYDRRVEREAGAGRKPQLPQSAAACFEKGYTISHRLAEYLKAVTPAFEEVENTDAEQLNARLLEKLLAFEAELLEAQTQIDEALRRVLHAKAYAHKCRGNTAEAEIAQKAAERADARSAARAAKAEAKAKAKDEAKPAKATKAAKPAKAAKPVKEAKAAKPAAEPAGECPKGGKHEWTKEDGEHFCSKCLEPKVKKKAQFDEVPAKPAKTAKAQRRRPAPVN